MHGQQKELVPKSKCPRNTCIKNVCTDDKKHLYQKAIVHETHVFKACAWTTKKYLYLKTSVHEVPASEAYTRTIKKKCTCTKEKQVLEHAYQRHRNINICIDFIQIKQMCCPVVSSRNREVLRQSKDRNIVQNPNQRKPTNTWPLKRAPDKNKLVL